MLIYLKNIEQLRDSLISRTPIITELLAETSKIGHPVPCVRFLRGDNPIKLHIED